jgi:hypothetical protein
MYAYAALERRRFAVSFALGTGAGADGAKEARHPPAQRADEPCDCALGLLLGPTCE